MKLKKIVKTKNSRLIAILIALILILALAVPASAISVSVSTLQVNSMDVYNNAYITGDLMAFVDFTIDYSTTPTEAIDQTFVVTWTSADGATAYGSSAPYAYVDNGYTRGVAAIYLTPDEVTAFGISIASDFGAIISGNPAASWSGYPIPVTATTFTSDTCHSSASVSAGQTAICTKITDTYAPLLQTVWGSSYTLVITSDGSKRLTSQGDTYFAAVVPYYSTVCANIASAVSATPELINRTYSNGWQATIDAGVDGTIFDLNDECASLGLPTRVTTSVLWILVMGFIIVALGRKIKSYKPTMLLSFPLLICGVLISWIPMLAGIGLFFLAGASSWYIFTYEKSGA